MGKYFNGTPRGSWPKPRNPPRSQSGARVTEAEPSGIRVAARTALHTALPEGERILLTGTTGQVGGELARILAPLAEVIMPKREELDLADEASVRAAVRRIRPRWIINPAAYTAVDKAESEPNVAYAVNATAVRAFGEEAAAIGAAVVHLSTDYVFDGTSLVPYREDDATNPQSVYGASKLAGELALRSSGAAHVILRTGWVFGATGNNFLRTILRLARERDQLAVVADQHGAPTWSRDLARLIVHIVIRTEILAATSERPFASQVSAPDGLGGLYHATATGETTWYGFAEAAIALQQALEPEAAFARLKAISTAEYPTAARRPVNSRLDCSRLCAAFDWQMMPWRDSLAAVMADIQPATP